jgi:hypothetical protein
MTRSIATQRPRQRMPADQFLVGWHHSRTNANFAARALQDVHNNSVAEFCIRVRG